MSQPIGYTTVSWSIGYVPTRGLTDLQSSQCRQLQFFWSYSCLLLCLFSAVCDTLINQGSIEDQTCTKHESLESYCRVQVGYVCAMHEVLKQHDALSSAGHGALPSRNPLTIA